MMKVRPSSKTELRKEAFLILGSLGEIRRKTAAKNLAKNLKEILHSYDKVLSFSSLPREIDMNALNSILMARGALVLPKVVNDHLELYEVQNEDCLVKSSWGILEPNPEFCCKAKDVCVILVPALLFDQRHHRLGYGRGFYDRLLKRLKVPAFGVGFVEQLYFPGLTVTKDDIALQDLYLF